jgi:hypothetical protein
MKDKNGVTTFISYATKYDLYVGRKDWNELTPEQQDKIILNEMSQTEGDPSDYIMSCDLKKPQAGGLRALLVYSSMLLERYGQIKDSSSWDYHQRQKVLRLLEGILIGRRLTEAFTPEAAHERTEINGKELEALEQSNTRPSVLDATLDMQFEDAKSFILARLAKSTREPSQQARPGLSYPGGESELREQPSVTKTRSIASQHATRGSQETTQTARVSISGTNRLLLRLISYSLLFITGTAPLASVSALIATFFSLGGWGWLLFMWFGFTGMFAFSLARQSSAAITAGNAQSNGMLLFAILGLVILGSAYFGGLWFWLSGQVERVSFWYGVLAPVAIIGVVMLFQSFR